MVEFYLSQAEADFLISTEKHRLDHKQWDYPGLGGTIRIPMISFDKREHFVLDISRGSINLQKGKYQTRCRQSIVLLRLDFGGHPHQNPDGQEVSSPHLHMYREGFGDKWAFPMGQFKTFFPAIENYWETLDHFMKFCNITRKPFINRGLFS
jgi:hypothetical protein